MNKNRLLSLIVSVMLVFTLVFPTGVFAEENESQDNEPQIEETVQPAEEQPTEEQSAEEQPAEEQPAEEQPAEEQPAEEQPAEEQPTEEQTAEEAAPVVTEESFEQGYVRINGDTIVYTSESKQEVKGTFTGSAVVYATVVSHAANEDYSWLRIIFDTAEAKEADEALLSGYVQFKDVNVLSDEAVEQLTESLKNDYTARSYGEKLLPVASFMPKAEEIVEVVAEEETTVEEETIVEEASDSSASSIKIMQQPASSEVAEGGYFIATVVAEGSNLTYQWQFKLPGTDTWKTSTSTAYKQAELKIKASATTDGRQYRCVISDDQGNSVTSDAVTLTLAPEPVENPIKITQQPASAEVAEGEYFIATVVAEGSNLTYQWQFKLPGTDTWKTSTSTTYKKAELKIKASTATDGRQYRCVVSDDQGNSVTSDAVTLTLAPEPVEDPIKITQQPASAEVAEGEYFIATVVAEGSNLTYQWQFKLPGTDTWKTSTSTTYKKAELKIKASTATDGRQYQCVISDDQGNSVTSDAVTLTLAPEPVEDPIKITQQPASAEVAEGEYFIATVVAEGSNLTYQWQFKLVGSDTWKTSTSATYKQAELKLKATSTVDGRQYRCVISDDQGNSVTSDAVTLTLAPEDPIKITQQPVSSEVAEGEHFIATVVAEGSNLTYQWQFKLVGSDTWKTSTSATYKQAELKLNATSTVDGRQYRCVISDDQGNSVISDEVTLTIVIPELTDGTFNYELTQDGSGVIVTKYLLTNSAVVVPSDFQNLPVVEIGVEAFMGNTAVVSVDLPNTVRYIRARAFKGCINLTEMKTH